jgi:hypothetical protein
MKKIILISRYAQSVYNSHSLMDDEYYFKFMIKSGVLFFLHTSEYSVKRLLEIYPEEKKHICVLDEKKIKYESGDKIIFLGYNELEVLKFIVSNLFRNPRIILIATNNISTRRVDKYMLFMKFFFLLTNIWLERLVLHTEYEKKIVYQLNKTIIKKVIVKKHHMMIPKFVSDGKYAQEKNIISYFGPNKSDKPIDPVIMLIRADVQKKFIYYIYRVKKNNIIKYIPNIKDYNNVFIIDEWQDNDDYIAALKNTKLLIMTHTKEYEGKLSGNLCDCISNNIVYIANLIEPMITYNGLYGDLGYLVNMSNPEWPKIFLNQYSEHDLIRMRQNLKRMGTDYTDLSIEADLRKIFLN